MPIVNIPPINGTPIPSPTPIPTPPAPGLVIPSATALIDENESALKLARYFQIGVYDENAGFGVNDGIHPEEACNPIWPLETRALTARYLREAQDEIEQVVGYPLSPRWFVAEQQPYGQKVHTRWMEVLAVGVRATDLVAAGVSVDHSTDPATITVVTAVTSPAELRLVYPGTEIEIVPSALSLAGGTATFQVPRARLVADQNTPDGGWDYSDLSGFLATVDVLRVYNDSSQQGTLVYPHRASECSCGHRTCGEATASACLYLRHGRTGALDALRADESGGTLTVRCRRCWGSRPEYVRLNYRAGLQTLTSQAEDAILRLAHSKMPAAPCGCGPIQEMWARDRNIPAVLDTERLNCPFGISDGAWIAWRFANAMARHRMSVM